MGLTNNLGKLSNMITSTGSAVGIGTSSPQSGYILDVKGFSQFGNSIYPNVIRLGDQDTNSTIIQSVSTAGVAKDLTFWNTSERMRIDSLGNVGIGTSSPSTKFQIYVGALANNGYDGMRIADDVAHYWLLARKDGSGNRRFAIYNGQNTYPITLQEGGGNVGIGITNPNAYLMVKGDGNTYNQLRLAHTTDGYFDIGVTSSVANLIANYNTTAIPMAFYTAASERMRITTSGNVGINTSNPGVALEVNGRYRTTSTYSSSGTTVFEIYNASSAGYGLYMGAGAGTNYSFKVADYANNERFTVLGNGNIGVGVTPTDWNTLTPIQIKNVAFAGYTSGTTHVLYAASNFYYGGSGGGDKYITNGAASLYSQAAGGHTWYTAPVNSSGAGAALSFNERMRILSNGNIGIGTSSPQRHFVVSNNGADGIELGNEGDSGSIISYNRSTGAWLPLTIQNGGGPVWIGTGSAINAKGLYIGGSASSYFNLYSDYSGSAVGFEMTNSSNALKVQFFGSSGNYYFAGSNISDRRSKSNIQQITEGLSKISQLKPSTFTYDKNPDIVKGGFIAQEVLEVIPEFVTIPEDENEMMGVDYFGILALAVKSIQELESRIKTLENNKNK